MGVITPHRQKTNVQSMERNEMTIEKMNTNTIGNTHMHCTQNQPLYTYMGNDDDE